MESQDFALPFPALTPAERIYLDVYGYVVLKNTFTPDETGTMREALHKLKRDLLAAPPGSVLRGAKTKGGGANRTYLVSIHEADPAISWYVTHPRMVGVSEELIGSQSRVVEVGGIINSRLPDMDPKKPNYGFHRGTEINFGSHIQNGLYHCNFVKVLTNLTELGPDDGGTVVIPGSHKMETPDDVMIANAMKDPSLVHQVIAPAGSTLLFSETLIHGTGQIRSDRERTILITGYATSLFPHWDDLPVSAEFMERCPAHLQRLFKTRAHWARIQKYRTLQQPKDERVYTPYEWAPAPEAALR
jgi:hypothetical protein